MTTASTRSATGARADAGRAEAGRSARIALWVFIGLIAVAVPVVLFHLDASRWFLRDDYTFLSERDVTSLSDLFAPHSVHWVTVLLLWFKGLYAIFGIRSYLPYEVPVLAMHLTACVLLRVIMRRLGVNPWIATVTAASFILYGPGQQNIVWAFQVGFTGSLAFGLAALVLADHDGPIDWRDWLALAAGLLSLMSSGVGIAMVAVVGLGLLGRRGWRRALLQVGPAAGAYLVWWAVEQPDLGGPAGRAPIGTLLRWLWSGETGIFSGLAHFPLAGLALGIAFVAGLILAWSGLPRRELIRQASIPVAMLLGGLLFSAMSGSGRWYLGADYAQASRYLHINTALALPAIAVAIDAIGRRWRVVSVALLIVLVAAVPLNLDDFDDAVFSTSFMSAQKRVITNIVRLPEAREVPRDLRPITDPFLPTIGWMVDAEAAGKLRATTGPMAPDVRNQMLVRLGVDQSDTVGASNCRTFSHPRDISPERGAAIGISKPVRISTRDGSRPTSKPVTFDPRYGAALKIRLRGLDLRLAPEIGATSFTMCDVTDEARYQTQFLRAIVTQSAGGRFGDCRQERGTIDLRPSQGTRLGFEVPLLISAHDGDRRLSPDVPYDPGQGNVLNVVTDRPPLRIRARDGGSFRLCSVD